MIHAAMILIEVLPVWVLPIVTVQIFLRASTMVSDLKKLLWRAVLWEDKLSPPFQYLNTMFSNTLCITNSLKQMKWYFEFLDSLHWLELNTWKWVNISTSVMKSSRITLVKTILCQKAAGKVNWLHLAAYILKQDQGGSKKCTCFFIVCRKERRELSSNVE